MRVPAAPRNPARVHFNRLQQRRTCAADYGIQSGIENIPGHLFFRSLERESHSSIEMTYCAFHCDTTPAKPSHDTHEAPRSPFMVSPMTDHQSTARQQQVRSRRVGGASTPKQCPSQAHRLKAVETQDVHTLTDWRYGMPASNPTHPPEQAGKSGCYLRGIVWPAVEPEAPALCRTPPCPAEPAVLAAM